MKIAKEKLINIFMDLFKTRHICVWIRNVFVKLIFVYGIILHLYIPISICVCIEMYL